MAEIYRVRLIEAAWPRLSARPCCMSAIGTRASVYVTSPSDGRSPVAVAAAWASRVLTISLEMVVPGLLGFWLDQQLRTRVLFLLLGLALGMGLAMWQLVQLANKSQAAGKNQRTKKK